MYSWTTDKGIGQVKKVPYTVSLTHRPPPTLLRKFYNSAFFFIDVAPNVHVLMTHLEGVVTLLAPGQPLILGLNQLFLHLNQEIHTF